MLLMDYNLRVKVFKSRAYSAFSACLIVSIVFSSSFVSVNSSNASNPWNKRISSILLILHKNTNKYKSLQNRDLYKLFLVMILQINTFKNIFLHF